MLAEIRAVLTDDDRMPLGPGSPNVSMRAALEQLQRDLMSKAKSRDFALACVAGLWLYHNFLEESHAISQDLHTIEGSYWHAILHRREPDYWNSKYWFRRVGEHPVFAALQGEATKLARAGEWSEIVAARKWDPAVFVDLCEENADTKATGHEFCRHVQAIEWKLLFEYCRDRAFA